MAIYVLSLQFPQVELTHILSSNTTVSKIGIFLQGQHFLHSRPYQSNQFPQQSVLTLSCNIIRVGQSAVANSCRAGTRLPVRPAPTRLLPNQLSSALCALTSTTQTQGMIKIMDLQS